MLPPNLPHFTRLEIQEFNHYHHWWQDKFHQCFNCLLPLKNRIVSLLSLSRKKSTYFLIKVCFSRKIWCFSVCWQNLIQFCSTNLCSHDIWKDQESVRDVEQPPSLHCKPALHFSQFRTLPQAWVLMKWIWHPVFLIYVTLIQIMLQEQQPRVEKCGLFLKVLSQDVAFLC